MSAVLAIICGVLVVGLDQLTKYLVTVYMEQGQTADFLPGFINFHCIEPNRGAAFGSFQGQTWFLIAVTVIIMVICVVMLIRKTFNSKLMFWALCLVLGGGIGNLIDRVFRGGGVIDFLEFDFIEFPVFNVADIAVCIGAGLIVLYFILDFVKEARKGKAAKAVTGEDSSEQPEPQENETDGN